MSDDELYSDVPETDDTIKWVRRPVNSRNVRSNQEYKAGRDQYRAKCAVHRNPDGTIGAPCVICGEPIDYNLQYPHPLSFSLEHIVAVKDHPELLMDRNNWASSHFGCNSMKGPEDLVPDTGEPSEAWAWLPLVTSGSFWLWHLMSSGALSWAGKVITRSAA